MSDAKELWASGASVATAITKAKPVFHGCKSIQHSSFGIVMSAGQDDFFFSFHTLGCYKFQDVHQKRCEDDGFLSSASKAERPSPVSPPTTSQSFRCVQPNFRMDYQPQWMSPGTESSCHRQQTKPWKANLVNDPMDWWEPTETGLPRCYFSTTQLQSSQELRAVKRMLFSMLRRENTTSMVPSYA